MIMLIEDSKLTRDRIKRLMPQFEYMEASNKEELLKHFPIFSKVDLVVSDINLQGENGLELCKMIRDLYPEVPIVILSSLAETLKQTSEMKEVKPLKVYDKADFSRSDFLPFVSRLAMEKLKARNTMLKAENFPSQKDALKKFL